MARLIRLEPMLILAGAIAVTASLAAHAQGTRQAGAASAPAPKASVEAGRELFGAHCARCHGAEATGTPNGPNLLPRVKGMSEASFASAVLQRYRWSLPASEGAGESAGREAMIRGVLSRAPDGAAMPAWESEPRVSQGVKSIYAYLGSKAR